MTTDEDEAAWLATQSADARFLVEEDVAFVGTHHQHEWNGPDCCKGQPHEPRLCVTMGDVFAYACADAEPITPDDVAAVAAIYRAHGYDGLIAWASRRRNEAPLIEYLETESYQRAWAALYGQLTVEPNACNKVTPRW